jgi:TonB family protein
MLDVIGKKSKYRLLLTISLIDGKLCQSGFLSYPFKSYESTPIPIKGYDNLEKYIIYPKDALESKIEGEVIIRFIIDIDGQVKNPEILYSPGYGLGEAAIKAIQSVKWEPGRITDKPVISSMTIPIEFKLPNK